MLPGLWMWLVLAFECMWAAVTEPLRAVRRRRRERRARQQARAGRHRVTEPGAAGGAPGSVTVGGDNNGTITTSVSLPEWKPGDRW